MDLKQVHIGVRRRRRPKRLGRGAGSGRGGTCGRGHKGQKSRAGTEKPHLLFEGGQMPIARRIPKRGFTNRWAKQFATINVRDLERVFQDGDLVDEESLRKSGLVKGRWDGIKLLGDGQLSRKLTVKVHRCSESARQKVLAAGGSVELVKQ
ncbi:MAG TPA: 50S ribosomal protein L15 [Planctomycetaceae bacterium]|nr:50S ribosomal protein L15 [Planctomycetaceae bacterium]